MLSTLLRNLAPSSLLLQLAVALPLAFGAHSAHAHISVDMGGTHMSRYSDDDLKESPCGMMGGQRGTQVYKYKPGATVNVSIRETVPHPGYFRISFDDDGDDGFKIPSGTDGMGGDCAGDPACGAGKGDYCNSDTVLLDQLDQHEYGGSGMYTWSVTLPNIECDNCTLQIIQVMNDFNFHPQAYPADDIYYQCIDLVLTKDAPDVTDMPVKNNGMVCKRESSGGAAGAPSAAGAGGASGTAGAPGTTSTGAGSVAAGTSGSAASTSATAGSTASANAGAGGSKAGSSSTGAPTTTTTTTGSAGSQAPGSGTRAAAGTGTAPGSSTSAVASAGTTSSDASAPAASESSGGCQAVSGSVGSLFAPAVLGLIALGLRSSRRRRSI
jgi:hypothetical protein